MHTAWLHVMSRAPGRASDVRPAVVANVRLLRLLPLPCCSEDVLWSTLFALAVIARATSESYVTHLLCLLAGGVLPALEGALEQYREVVPHEPDEMIARAGDYLVTVLRTARQLVWIRRTRKLTRLALVGLVAVVSLRWLRTRVGQRHTASIRQ